MASPALDGLHVPFGSRQTLRGLMWLAVGISLLFLPASLRSAGNLNAQGHHFVGMWVALAPWIGMALATVLGTCSQFEDDVFRRRALAGVMLAVVFPALGHAMPRLWPGLRLAPQHWGHEPFDFTTSPINLWTLYWISSFYGLMPFNGAGPWIDRPLTRWFGAGLVATTASREREKEIRETATRDERNRLARDLHDSIKQEIFAIHTSAATAQARFHTDPAGALDAIERVRSSARDAMLEMEALLERLDGTPLDNDSLVAALRKQCDALAIRTGAAVECRIGQLPDAQPLRPGVHDAFFRIAQEALTNVARHARATHVRVTLEVVDSFLQLTIADDGQGFDRKQAESGRGHMGLRNIALRAAAIDGRLELRASPGQGTTLRISVLVLARTVFGFKDQPRRVQAIYVVGAATIILPMLAAVVLVLRSTLDHPTDWSAAELLGLLGVIVAFVVPRLILDHIRGKVRWTGPRAWWRFR